MKKISNYNFKKYAKIYDLINSNKDYLKEFQYFDPLIECERNSDILEIGSGTGNFSNLLAKKYKLQGMPSAYIFDGNSRLSMKHVGFKKSDIAEYEKNIVKLLDKLTKVKE